MNVDEKRIAELAVMATALDPKKVAEANAKMEADLVERMKSMPYEERMKLLAVQKIVTERAVQTLGSLNDGQGGLNLDAIKSSIDPKTLNDEKILLALRSHDIDSLQKELQAQGRDSFTTVRFVSDPEGHPLLHWAALDNNLTAAEFLFSAVSPTMHHKLTDQRNIRGETPLIWACMKGHSRMVCELLRRGADVHAACSKGYTAMHVAAQNGHVFTMAQLARRGLPVDVRDNNGRTPLHWAAYKGFEHATKWLLSHGADPGAQDWEKCTPLHWASLRANAAVAALLVEQGASGAFFNLKDKTGGTPLELAEQKVNKITQDLQSNPENEKVPGKNSFTKHSYEAIVSYFKRLQVVQDDIDANGGHPTLLLRIRAKMPHWSYFLWPILAPIGWWQYATVVWPVTSHHLLLHAIFAICFWAKWVFWVRLQIRDPGEYVEPHGPPGTTLGTGPSLPSWGWRRGGMPDFTNRKLASPHNGNDIDTKHTERKPGTGDIEEALRLVSSDVRATRVTSNPRMNAWAAKHRALYDRVLDEGLAVPVCLTCEIVKPVRAKHDKISDVCVAKFDHFCPWMNSCVGELNYTDFFFTAVSATIAMWAWLILVVYYTWEVNTDNGWWTNFIGRFWWEMFAWMYSLMALYGLAMTAQHIHLAAKNLSTNEMISGYRYRYLVEDGTRGNPFDRGILSNFAELLGILPPLRIDPEEYYSVELAGGPLRPVPLPVVGSPWNRSSMSGGHGHSHGLMDEESHGHSHGNNNSHNHSHAHGGGGGGGGHSHAQGNHHGHSH